jgi:hypothetical protein
MRAMPSPTLRTVPVSVVCAALRLDLLLDDRRNLFGAELHGSFFLVRERLT